MQYEDDYRRGSGYRSCGALTIRVIQLLFVFSVVLCQVFILISAPTVRSITLVQGTRSSKVANDITKDSKLLQFGIWGFCKKDACIGYGAYAVSPAAKAIKKAKNPDSKVATERIEAAGLIGSNAGDLIAGDLKALRKLKLTAGEKKAAYAFSGYGPMSSDKKWVIVIVLTWSSLGLAAVVFALLLILAVKGTYVEEESTSNPLRQVVFVMVLLLLVCTAVSLGLIAVVSGNIKTHVPNASFGFAYAACIFAFVAVVITLLFEGSYLYFKLKASVTTEYGGGRV